MCKTEGHRSEKSLTKGQEGKKVNGAGKGKMGHGERAAWLEKRRCCVWKGRAARQG